MIRLSLFAGMFCLVCTGLSAQNITRESSLDDLSLAFAKNSWNAFYDFLALPNDAHFPEDMEKNIQWCEQAFSQRGFKVQRLPTPELPLLLAELPQPGAEKTVLVYLQIDGQPVDPSAWFQENPFVPVLKEKDATGNWQIIPWARLESDYQPEWRIFARSTSDAKGPAMAFLQAFDITTFLEKSPNYNLKVIMDFEEELGSPNLPPAVARHKALLSADMLIICDGPRHITNQPTLTFGARGIATITLQVFGPKVAQHSGHYGNYAPNPALRLAQLLSGMKDEEGRVTIPGFYEGIALDDATRSILAQVPDDEKFIQENLGIAAPDQVGNNYQEALQYPSLNIRGLSSAWTGKQVRTVVPAEATAEIDIRLVPESDPKRLIQLVRDYITSQGYHITDQAPTDAERQQYSKILRMESSVSYLAFRTDFDSEVGLWLDRAMVGAFGKTPIKIRSSGGSIPISPFVQTLGIPAVTVPIVNRDNNQHSPNENIRLGNYVDGIKTYLAILLEAL